MSADQPLNIVFISPHSDPEAKPGEIDSGGQCVYEYELGKNLARFGHKVVAYSRQRPGMPKISRPVSNFEIRRIVCGGEEFLTKEQIGPSLDEFSCRVAQDLELKPDIVHGHYWDGGKASLLLAKYLNRTFPMIWTPHSLGTVKRRNFRGIRNEMKYNFVSRVAWETFIMLQASNVVVSSTNEQSLVIEDYGIYEPKLSVIPPGIEVEKFSEAEKDLEVKADWPKGKILVTMGRLDRRKGYHHCIKLLAEIKKQRPQSPIFLVIYAGGKQERSAEKEYREELQKMIADLQLDDHVLIKQAAPRAQVPSILKLADAYLCLSEYEPFGLTILESMSCKTLVIATANGGPSDIINDDSLGIIGNPENSSALAKKILGILENEKAYQLITEKAYQQVNEIYSWQKTAERFSRHYQTVTNNFQPVEITDFLKHISQL